MNTLLVIYMILFLYLSMPRSLYLNDLLLYLSFSSSLFPVSISRCLYLSILRSPPLYLRLFNSLPPVSSSPYLSISPSLYPISSNSWLWAVERSEIHRLLTCKAREDGIWPGHEYRQRQRAATDQWHGVSGTEWGRVRKGFWKGLDSRNIVKPYLHCRFLTKP